MEALVINYQGKPCTTSRLVTEKFNKEHKDVLEAIRNILTAENSAVLEMFFESSYYNEQNKKQPMFIMNRDGFSLLVMGFTGEKALQFKVEYIKAFNRMESLIHSNLDKITRGDLIKMLYENEQEKERLQEINHIQQKELIEAAPKLEYHKKVLDSTGTVKINVIAEDLGISAQKLNRILAQQEIQYLQNGVWFLYSEYRSYGIAFHKSWPYYDINGEQKTRQHLYWTEKGRNFIHVLLNTSKKEALKFLS